MMEFGVLGASSTEVNFLCDITRLLQKNMSRVASSMKESMGCMRDLVETLLVFLGAEGRTYSNTAMESILAQLLESIDSMGETFKHFHNQSIKLKESLNAGADVEGEVHKQFVGRLDVVSPKFKNYVTLQKAFFQSVESELDTVYVQIAEKSESAYPPGVKKKPPVPAPRPRTAHAAIQKGGGSGISDMGMATPTRTQRSGSLEGPTGGRPSPGHTPARGYERGAYSYDDLSREYAALSYEEPHGKLSPVIPIPSAPRPDGEAPPPSRPSSTQVEYVPSKNLSASQTLLATVSALGGIPGTAPVLVNSYHPHSSSSSSPPASPSSPTNPTTPPATPIRRITDPITPTRTPSPIPSIHSSSPVPTRKPPNATLPSPPIRNITKHNRSASDGGNESPPSPQRGTRRIVPPVFEGDSGEWTIQSRQAKGTTGVDPVLVQGRRAYWSGHQEKILSPLQQTHNT